MKKSIAFFTKIVYTSSCCGMIAVKREVAMAEKSVNGFSVERMSS